MTLTDLKKVVKDIHFRDWKFRVLEKGDGFLLQILFLAPDSVSGKVAVQHCRKWYISSHATHAEVVRTAWKAVVAAVEHEAAESFTYKGATIYNPHVDPDALIEVHHRKKVRE